MYGYLNKKYITLHYSSQFFNIKTIKDLYEHAEVHILLIVKIHTIKNFYFNNSLKEFAFFKNYQIYNFQKNLGISKTSKNSNTIFILKNFNTFCVNVHISTSQ